MKNLKQKIAQKVSQLKRLGSQEELTIHIDRKWINNPLTVHFYSWPFPHATVDNFLTPEGIREMENFFVQNLEATTPSFQHLALYDLYARAVGKNECSVIKETSFSLKQREFVESLLGISVSNFTTIALHNNTPRHDDKYIHNDAVPVVFRNKKDEGMTGPSLAGTEVKHFLSDNTLPLPDGYITLSRVATTILYLSRDWVPGLGGETGIFTRQQGVDIECASIEPKFNRLLIFQNTPLALHNYKACSLPSRKSLIQWYHA